MPVYMVYICHSVSERAQLEKYWASIGPTLEGQTVKFLAGYTPFEVLEGENVLGVLIAEWPSLEAARAWYESPGYKAIRHLRQELAAAVHAEGNGVRDRRHQPGPVGRHHAEGGHPLSDREWEFVVRRNGRGPPAAASQR